MPTDLKSIVRVSPPLCVLLIVLSAFLPLQSQKTNAAAHTESRVVCIHLQKKEIRHFLLKGTSKTCPKGERKAIWTKSNVPSNLCVTRLQKLIQISTSTCPVNTRLATDLSQNNRLKVCINKKSRTIQRLISKRCPISTATSIFFTRQSSGPSAPISSNPLVVGTPDVPQVPTLTTTSTSTTTTLAPSYSLTASTNTVEPGTTVALLPIFSTGQGSIDHGVGTVLNNQIVSIRTYVTTTYTLSVIVGDVTQYVTTTVYVHTLSITQQPIDTTSSSDSGSLLSVQASATGALTYQWYLNNQPIADSQSNMHFARFTGSYSVRVTSNLNGHTIQQNSNSVNFQFNSVNISHHPIDQTIGDGDTAHLAVTATGSGDVRYQWYRDSVLINNATFRTFDTTQGGSYYVEVSSILNGTTRTERSSNAYVDRNVVNITAQPVNSLMTAGRSIIIGIAVSGGTGITLAYQWYLDNQPINAATNFVYTATAAGAYKVIVTSNKNGTTSSVTSDTITVTEIPNPTISTVVFGSSSIATGSSTTITGTFAGGTGVITPGNITVTSGQSVAISPATTTAYTLTITNPQGYTTSATQTLIVTNGSVTSTSNNMVAPREQFPNAIKLLDGRVLIFGNQVNFSTTAEIFDPTTNSFTQTGSLNQGRGNTRAVLLNDGRVLIAGGLFHTTTYIALATCEIYDPVTGAFSTTGSLISPRKDHEMVLLADGRVMVLGGTNSSHTPLSSTDIFNPATGTWSSGPAMARARQQVGALALTDGRILVFGGWNTANGNQKSAEIYDPATNRFTLLSDQMNLARVFQTKYHYVALPDGDALIVGGENGGLPLGPIEYFDGATNTFSNFVSALSTPVFGQVVTTLQNGLVAIFGGATGSSAINSIFLYDPSSGVFIQENVTMQHTRYYNAGVTLNDGRVLIIGGNWSAGSTAELYTN